MMHRIIGMGQVGSCLFKELPNAHIMRYDLKTHEWGFPNDFFDVIWLTAAVTDVNLCEQDSLTGLVNYVAVQKIVDAIKKLNHQPILVFYSTDYVFDGGITVPGPYHEGCPPNPINRYGYQKLAAEHYIKDNLEKYYIIRTNMVYGPDPKQKNFACRTIKQFMSNPQNHCYYGSNDVVTPTFGPDLAKNSIKLVMNHNMPSGIYHIAGKQQTSRFDFAKQISKELGLDIVHPVGDSVTPEYIASLKEQAQREGSIVVKKPIQSGLISNVDGFMCETSIEEGIRLTKESMI
jgi:dTDP-4-dehydrorhamnose reductase